MAIRQNVKKLLMEASESGITLSGLVDMLREENRELKNQEKMYPEYEMEFRRKLKNFFGTWELITDSQTKKKNPLPIFFTEFKKKQSMEIMTAIFLCDSRDEAESLLKQRLSITKPTIRNYYRDIAYSLKQYYYFNGTDFNQDIPNYDLIRKEVEEIAKS